MNKLLNHIAQAFRWISKIVFSQVPEGFFAHSVAQFGSDIPSIRQVKHRKPPFYSSGTKQFSCNGLSTAPVAEGLHEQDTVIESRDWRIDIVLGIRKGRRPRNNWCNAKASSCWESPILDYNSKGTPEKRPNYKGTLEASQPRWLSHHAKSRINLLKL